ncbi:MAG: hypothetical protein WBQ86_03915 [Candidatus Binatus sp.]
MQVSIKPKSLCSRIARIAAAVGFALVIGSFGVGPAGAADHRGGGDNHGGGGDHRGGGDNHGGYRGGGGGYWGGVGGNYYAPQPDYYVAPEPYNYGDAPEYDAPPPQGISLFFGL